MKKIWRFLLDDNHRKALSFLGAGMVIIISAAWTAYVYWDRTPDATGRDRDDVLLERKMLGTWDRGTLNYPNNVSLKVEYTLSPGNKADWTGRGMRFGQSFGLIMSGTWKVENGFFAIKVISSNIPTLVAPGYSTQTKLNRVTGTEIEYFDRVLGRQVVDRRIR